MTTQVNPTLTEVQNLFKSLVWEPFLTAGETYLFTSVPFLNAPVLGPVLRYLISFASDAVYKKFVLFVDVTTIKFLDSAHQSAYESASIKLMIILKTKGANSSEYQNALQDAIKSQIALTRANQ